MTLKLAIEEAVKEAAAFHVTVKVVKSPAGSSAMEYFPCRKEWLEGAGSEYVLVAEAAPNGKVYKIK